MDFDNLEDRRRLHNSIIIATIDEIDWEKYEMRVRRGDIITGWLKFPGIISNTYRYHQPIKEGMQVVMACASGDLNGASVVGVLWSDDVPPPTLPVDKRAVTELAQFDDGSFVKYDKDTGTLEIEMTKGDIRLKANHITIEAEQIHLNAEVLKVQAAKIELISGTLTHNGINVGSTHKHMGVMPGKAVSGGPL